VTVAKKTSTRDQGLAPVIRVSLMPELKVYQVSEAELEQLADGPPGQLHLNFALAMLPAALTILITLQTVDIPKNRTYYTYIIAFGLLATQGLISLARWWFTGGALTELVEEIRSRMPEKPGVPEQITASIAQPEPEPPVPGSAHPA
jgi:hypothetical protein